MDALRRARDTADAVRDAVAGAPISKVAQAADTDPAALHARLSGHDAINVADLIGVGGFLRVEPSHFLKGSTP